MSKSKSPDQASSKLFSNSKNNSIKTSPEKNTFTRKEECPIVAIGASAGGLEAFSELLKHLPSNTGMAYVFIQHLSPNHESILSQILARISNMPVKEVQDKVKIAANNVYVIKPNTNIELSDHIVEVSPRGEDGKPFYPIDYFMKSLADIMKNKAIGIILSGTGADGALGMKAIKNEGGLTFVQDLETAKFPDMPNNVSSSGNTDFILSPKEMARELSRIGKHPYIAFPTNKTDGESFKFNEDEVDSIFRILLDKNNVDFSNYKSNTINRRIDRRLVLNKVNSIKEYIKYLEENPNEVDLLFNDLLINVTGFFRDKSLFENIKTNIFPNIFQYKTKDEPLRIWVPGSSTGEEAYSIAICIMEYFEENKLKNPVQIFATDINETSIEKARLGIYPGNIVQNVSEERLNKHFVKSSSGFQISRKIRELCVFAKHNLERDPPFSKMDIISCRNLLIYLSPNLQKKVIPTFHYALNNNGFLILGLSESIGRFADLFKLFDKKDKIYLKKSASSKFNFNFAVPHNKKHLSIKHNIDGSSDKNYDVEREVEKIMLSEFSPPGVLIDEEMNIIKFLGNTKKFLEPASGLATFNLFKMLNESLLLNVRSSIKKAKDTQTIINKYDISFDSNGISTNINLSVVPIFKNKNTKPQNFLILFRNNHRFESDGFPIDGHSNDGKGENSDDGKSSKTAADFNSATFIKIEKLEEELIATKEFLSTLLNEKDAANEELHSTLEELQSSNEEMQSNTEEMETAKEELQSTNEELTTVNDELENQNEELTNANNDLLNILSSVNIPIIMLDGSYRIRRFTPACEKIFNLLPNDVGRVFNDIRSNLKINNLNALIKDVINTLQTKETEVQDLENNWFILKIKPYKTVENKIDGAIILLTDIDKMKSQIDRLTLLKEYAEAIIENINQPFVILDNELRIKTANHSFCNNFKVQKNEIEENLIYNIGNGQWNTPQLKKMLEQVITNNENFSNYTIEHDFPNIGKKRMKLNARKIEKYDDSLNLILLSFDEEK